MNSTKIYTRYKTWTPTTEQDYYNGPCGECCYELSIDNCDDHHVWRCCHGTWIARNEDSAAPLPVWETDIIMPKITRRILSSTDKPHGSDACPGNCSLHPLLTAESLAYRNREDMGMGWGDIAEMDYLEALNNETSAQRNARILREKEEEERKDARIQAFSVNKKADKWTRGGEMKFRVPRPCKYASMYVNRICSTCNAHVPESETHCRAKTHLHVSDADRRLAGCWTHEQNRTCIYVHPDEPQWDDACSGKLCYDRERHAFYLRGQELAPANRFTMAVASNKRDRNDSHSQSQTNTGSRKPRHEDRTVEHHHRRHTHDNSAW